MTEDIQYEIAKSLAALYADLGDDKPQTFIFTRNQIATLRASERIRVVVLREHDEPQHPLIDMRMAVTV